MRSSVAWCKVLVLLLLVVGCSADKHERLKIGDPSPDFMVEDLAGRSVSLKEWKGKPVVLRFFVTDCKFCRADTRVFNEYYEKHRGQGLLVLYLTTTVDIQRVRKFTEELKIPFPVAIDYNKKVSGLYRVKVEPQTIVLDGDHLIRGAILGGVTEAELDEILGDLWS